MCFKLNRYPFKLNRHALSLNIHAFKLNRHALSLNIHAFKLNRHALSFNRHLFLTLLVHCNGNLSWFIFNADALCRNVMAVFGR